MSLMLETILLKSSAAPQDAGMSVKDKFWCPHLEWIQSCSGFCGSSIIVNSSCVVISPKNDLRVYCT